MENYVPKCEIYVYECEVYVYNGVIYVYKSKKGLGLVFLVHFRLGEGGGLRSTETSKWCRPPYLKRLGDGKRPESARNGAETFLLECETASRNGDGSGTVRGCLGYVAATRHRLCLGRIFRYAPATSHRLCPVDFFRVDG